MRYSPEYVIEQLEARLEQNPDELTRQSIRIIKDLLEEIEEMEKNEKLF